MSYRGRPSKGCDSCRSRKVKCDETKPACHRCSKSGYECKYRDQGDLLFRNQTAVAAQKAEESWRKRSKVHQRAGSDIGRQSPTQHSSPSTDHDSPHSGPPSEGSSILNLTKLDIGAEIAPDLRQQAYERFLYDFVVFGDPTTAPTESSQAIWDFVPILYDSCLAGSCLAEIVHAVSYTNFNNRRHAPQAETLARECVGRGLKLLSQAIADPEDANKNETLASVYLMGVYHNITSSLPDGIFLRHKEGANALLALRSIPELFNDSVSASLFQAAYSQMLLTDLSMGRRPTIPIRSFGAAKDRIPIFYSMSGVYVMKLIHAGAILHAQWHEIRSNPTQPSTRGELHDILHSILELDGDFQAWQGTVAPQWQYRIDLNTYDARTSYDPKIADILGSPGASREIHACTSMKRSWIWMFYQTCRMFLLRDLQEILERMLSLPEPAGVQKDHEYIEALNELNPEMASRRVAMRTPLDTVTLQIHQTFTTNHLVHLLEQTCAGVQGHLTIPIYGKRQDDVVGIRGYCIFWPLGVMDAILKSGVIPDAGEIAVSPVHHSPPTSYSVPPFRNQPHPSPSLFGRPPDTQIHPYYHNPETAMPNPRDFPKLSPIPSYPAPSPSPPVPDISLISMNEPIYPRTFGVSESDISTTPLPLPATDLDGLQPPKINVKARRGWICKVLQYLADDLGIKKANAFHSSL